MNQTLTFKKAIALIFFTNILAFFICCLLFLLQFITINIIEIACGFLLIPFSIYAVYLFIKTIKETSDFVIKLMR